MAVDTTPIGRCYVCGSTIIADEPSAGSEEQPRHSGCRPITVREGLTIAEDALRAIASPDCGLTPDDDGHLVYDSGAAGRIAEGTLRRLKAVSDERDADAR